MSADAAGFTLSTNCPSWCVQQRCTGAHWGAEHMVPVVRKDRDRWAQPPEVIVGAHMDGETRDSDHILEVYLSIVGTVSWTGVDPRDVDAGAGLLPANARRLAALLIAVADEIEWTPTGVG